MKAGTLLGVLAAAAAVAAISIMAPARAIDAGVDLADQGVAMEAAPTVTADAGPALRLSEEPPQTSPPIGGGQTAAIGAVSTPTT